MLLDIKHKPRGGVTPSRAFDADGLQFAWSASTIKAAETCLRYYQYSVLEQWHAKGKGVHLRFGGHYATALEHFHKHRALGMEYDDAVRAIVREALEATWERGGCDTCNGEGLIDQHLGGAPQSHAAPCPDCDGTGNAKEGRPWDSMHNTKTRENLIRTIVWYLEQFRDDAAKVITLADGTPGVELSAVLPVDNGIVFAAHIDRMVDYVDNVYVMDQKTTQSTVSQSYFNNYSPDTQMSMYTFIGKAVFQTPIKGVIIDAAQIAVGFSRFERGFTFRSDGQLNEWYDSTMAQIERARKATDDQFFPMTTTSCGNYGGCEFRGICSRDPGARKAFLKGDFIQGGGYDPLEIR